MLNPAFRAPTPAAILKVASSSTAQAHPALNQHLLRSMRSVDGYGSMENLLQEFSDAERFHLCRICYDKKGQSLVPLTPHHTTQIKRHLRSHGYDNEGSKRATVSRKRKRSNEDVTEALKRQKTAQSTVFSRSSWKTAYLAWVVSDDVSLRKASSQHFRDLVGYHNTTVAPVLPESHHTTRAAASKPCHSKMSGTSSIVN